MSPKLPRVSLGLAIALALAGLACLGPDRGPVAPRKGVASASPALQVSGADWADDWTRGFHGVYAQLLSNLKKPQPPFTTRWAQPSPIYLGAYLWDSAFIALIWKGWDPATAMEVDEAVWGNAAPDGRLKHFVSPYASSDMTQPPLMAWSVGEVYQAAGDRDYLERAYPALVAYHQWLYQNRRLDSGLFHWLHSYESGIDNSPRFTSADEYDAKDLTAIAAVDLNAFMVQEAEALAAIAAELGRADDARGFADQAESLRALINAALWDEETGYYYDLDLTTGHLVKIRTIASFFPLFAGVPDPARAARLRDHLMDPDQFDTYFPLPSVARDDPSFEKDCWRGPVWINTAYLAILGLERHGFRAEAARLAFKLADGVYRNYRVTGEFLEFYDPDHDGTQDLHRKRGNLYKRLTLGDKPRPNFVGWTGLANVLAVEHLIGLRSQAGGFVLAPSFPPEAAGATFVLTVPAADLELTITARPDGGGEGQVAIKGAASPFSLQAGEAMPLPL